jgi:hypothetical protein
MKQLGKWMLGAAMVAGTMGLGATAAHAQVGVGVYVGGGPVAYVPPCPGPGYEWMAGYYSGGYWVPGQWVYARAHYYDRDDYRRGGYHYDRDWDRHRDGDHDRGEHRGWDHDRGEHRGWDRDGDHFRR